MATNTTAPAKPGITAIRGILRDGLTPTRSQALDLLTELDTALETLDRIGAVVALARETATDPDNAKVRCTLIEKLVADGQN